VIETSSTSLGHAIRAEVLRALLQPAILHGLCRLSSREPAAVWDAVLPAEMTRSIQDDLASDKGWERECWTLNDEQQVQLVDPETFEGRPPQQRFSTNECLRHPSNSSFALRGYLSALISDEFSGALSRSFEQSLKFCSADIARYRHGDYLRRHCDDFGGRRVGLVWFFGPDWTQDAGGELFVEDEFGRGTVIPPIDGKLVGLSLGAGSFHQVAQITSKCWLRYSVATHFAQC